MSDLDSSSPLYGVRLKLIRAQKHVDEVLSLLTKYTHGECRIAPEKNLEMRMTVLRIRLTPKVSSEVSAAAGDALFNLRAVLDHLVWALVLRNLPNVPGPSNQFPIVDSSADFEEALKRKRLRGVPDPAITLIKALQPYNTGNGPLAMLNNLHNTDKHRALNVVTVVADNTELLAWRGERAPYLQMFLGDEELRDGESFGNVGVPFELPPEFAKLNERLPEMQMYGKCSLFVAFDNPSADELEGFRVDRTLQEILEFVRDTVVPTFEPFFN